MTLFLNKLIRIFKQLRGLLPSPLPTGAPAFAAWVDDIKSTYDLPTQDLDSVEFSFSTMIMHSGPTTSSKPKYYFVKAIRAAAAKQVAGSVFQSIKLRQQATAKLNVEATANSPVAHETPH